MEIKNSSNIFTSEELLKINQHRYKCVVDDTIKKKLENSEKNIPFKKVIYKTKKNRKLRKFNNTYEDKFKCFPDPYKFKCIPTDIKNTINILLKENNMELQTLAYKLKLPLHKLEMYLNQNGLLDNYELNKILKYFNYTIDFNIKNKILNDSEYNYDSEYNDEMEYI